MIPPALFFLKIVLAIQGLSYFHTNFRIICSSCMKNATGILIRIALNAQIALGSIVILTILILIAATPHQSLTMCGCPLVTL